MICNNCGKEVKETDKVCSNCGTQVEIEKALYKKEKSFSDKKTQAKRIVTLTFKLLTAVSILVFVIFMFMDWYNFSGTASFYGFPELTEDIISEEAIGSNGEIPENYQGSYAKLSPIKLVKHVLDYNETYKTINTIGGEQKTSIFSIFNIGYVYGFLLVLILAGISIVILVVTKDLKGINFVKLSSFITIGVLLINYLALRITYFSMIAINAQSNLILENGVNAVSMNKDGILMNSDFYPYKLTLEPAFMKACICLAIWAAISAVFGEIKRNRQEKAEDEAMEQEVANE